MREPSFWSQVLTDIADPDYTHVALDVLPAHATADPAAWARSLLSRSALPRWLAIVLTLRVLLTPRRARRQVFAVLRVAGDEALIACDARRFDVRVGVGVDEESALVRVVAVLRYKGSGAQLLSLPVRITLPFLMRGMIARTRRTLSGVTL